MAWDPSTGVSISFPWPELLFPDTKPSPQLVSAVYPTPDQIYPYPEASGVNVSDEYYRLSSFMPRGAVLCTPCDLREAGRKLPGTHMTWGLNLGYDNATNAVKMAQSIFQAYSPTSEATKNGVVLDLIELGMSLELFAPTCLMRRLRGRKRTRSLPRQSSTIRLDRPAIC